VKVHPSRAVGLIARKRDVNRPHPNDRNSKIGQHQQRIGQLALPVLERMNALNPRNPRIHNRFAECYMINGDFDKAQEWITRGLELNTREPLLRLNQGLLYAFTGRKKEAEASREEIQGDKLESVRLYGQLFINAALGNLDEAFKALDRTAETHSWPALIKTLPVFAELRKDPRYTSFCGKVGLA